MKDSTPEIFMLGITIGALALGLIVILMLGNGPDLGEGCEVYNDGSAVCQSEDGGWYFEPGTF